MTEKLARQVVGHDTCISRLQPRPLRMGALREGKRQGTEGGVVMSYGATARTSRVQTRTGQRRFAERSPIDDALRVFDRKRRKAAGASAHRNDHLARLFGDYGLLQGGEKFARLPQEQSKARA